MSSPTVTPAQAAELIKAATPTVRKHINEFTRDTFQTRGGRLGSGMGLTLENLWGYHTSIQLEPSGLEIAWLADNQYHDYACLEIATDWDPATGAGELLRAEAKSMNLGADESKGHFAELADNIRPDDLLVILTWRWAETGAGRRVWPEVQDIWVDRALSVARLRDALHIARGGSFVDRQDCPDGCESALCTHHGEPLNSSGKRERLQGPMSCKPSGVSFAANFGGLVRMIATRGDVSRGVLAQVRAQDPMADDYVNFILRNRGRL